MMFNVCISGYSFLLTKINLSIIYIYLVGPCYTAALYNTNSNITQSDLVPRFMESMIEHFYVKWHDIFFSD